MCWFCGSPVAAAEPIGRSFRCEECGKDLRVCKHCRFYLPGSRGDCAEPAANPPAEKDRANFCDWFALDAAYRATTAGQGRERDKARAAKTAFDELFT
ncbi:MAG: hypothetical protein LBK27_08360 [Treponema sp.]|jgi:hypothetical protein|nr:hypothetical protein [Treponema sp.]